MKLMRHSVLFLALIGIFSLSSCDDDSTTTPTEVTPRSLAAKLDATWIIASGTGLPEGFDPLESAFSIRFDVDSLAINPVTGEEIGPDGGFFTVFTDPTVQRFDYNNQALSGYWELSDNGVTTTNSDITFFHVTSAVTTSPGVGATPISLSVTFDAETQEASEVLVNFTLPVYSNDNPGGEKAGEAVYSYTLVKDGTLD